MSYLPSMQQMTENCWHARTAGSPSPQPYRCLAGLAQHGPGSGQPDHVDRGGTLDRLYLGAIVWENARYDARYAIDLPELRARLRQHVPVLHLGQVPAVDAVKAATPGTRWFVVTVWCPREEAARRAEARGTGDVAERLRAWDETQPLAVSDLVVDTAQTPPSACARTIDQRARDGGVGTLPPAAGSADAG
jgi:guanylate kinase